MSIDTVAILFGTHSVDDLASVLKNAGVAEKVDVNDGRLNFKDATSGDARMMQVFSGAEYAEDYAEVYDGERTLVRMGAWGRSAPILRVLVETFGGFLNESDAVDKRDPILISRIRGEPSAYEKLAMDFVRLLGPEKAQALRSALGDPELRRGLEEALAQHREASEVSGLNIS